MEAQFVKVTNNVALPVEAGRKYIDVTYFLRITTYQVDSEFDASAFDILSIGGQVYSNPALVSYKYLKVEPVQTTFRYLVEDSWTTRNGLDYISVAAQYIGNHLRTQGTPLLAPNWAFVNVSHERLGSTQSVSNFYTIGEALKKGYPDDFAMINRNGLRFLIKVADENGTITDAWSALYDTAYLVARDGYYNVADYRQRSLCGQLTR